MPQTQENVQVEKATCVAVTVGTSSDVLCAANPQRVSLLVYNAGSQTVYVEPTGAATVAGSMPIVAGGSWEERDFVGLVNAISGTAGQDVRVWESG